MKTKLTPEQQKRFETVAYHTYNAVGYDVWGEYACPSKANFFCCIQDQMYDGSFANPPLSQEEKELWRSLSTAEQKRIIFKVGP